MTSLTMVNSCDYTYKWENKYSDNEYKIKDILSAFINQIGCKKNTSRGTITEWTIFARKNMNTIGSINRMKICDKVIKIP